MKINLKMALVVTAAAVLAACGSSDNGPVTSKVVTADTVAAASPATTAAVYKLPLTFPAGVPELGTTSSTTVTFDTPSAGTEPAFTIAGFGQGTASGTTAFGSCIFKVLSSSFRADHPLATGQTFTVKICDFKINTKGMKADGNAVKRKLKVKFGNTESNDQDVDVKVDRDGNVKVNDKDEGKTSTEDVTGGSS